MNQTRYDVIVLGLGGMGSAACAHLAKRGVRVLGLEQFPLNHDRGSSHGETRIIRMAYFEHPDYVPLLRRAYQLWAELEAETGGSLYQETGLLLSGPADGEAIAGASTAARQHQIPIESLSPAQVRRRFPGIQLPEDHAVLFEPRAGFLRVEDCVATHLQVAQRHGAELRDHLPVRTLRIHEDHVRLKTAAESFSADRLVVTAGAWTSLLLAEQGLDLRVLRKFVGWFDVAPGSYQHSAGSPCFYVEQPDGAFYGFPSLDGSTMKVAEHTGGQTVTDPATVDRGCYTDDVTRLTGFLDRVFPEATERLRRHSVCLYTLSRDQHFIIDRLPHAGHVTVACGFSGHGFKFASVVGQILADLALQGSTGLPADFLGLSRFSARPECGATGERGT